MSNKKKNKKNSKLQNQDEFIFDENSFDFSVLGGPIHTDLLIVKAIYKHGDKMGEPVPVKCQWFNIKNDQLIEIENVTGGFYQPCVEDVGSKIYIQATPIATLQEYVGMPVFKEIGPLIMDQGIEKEVNSILQAQCYKGKFRLETSDIPLDLIWEKSDGFPLEIIITPESIQFLNNTQLLLQFSITCEFPFIRICRNTNNIFEVFPESSKKLRLKTEGNLQRDLVATVLKMFCGQKIFSHRLFKENSGEDVSSSYTQLPTSSFAPNPSSSSSQPLSSSSPPLSSSFPAPNLSTPPSYSLPPPGHPSSENPSTVLSQLEQEENMNASLSKPSSILSPPLEYEENIEIKSQSPPSSSPLISSEFLSGPPPPSSNSSFVPPPPYPSSSSLIPPSAPPPTPPPPPLPTLLPNFEHLLQIERVTKDFMKIQIENEKVKKEKNQIAEELNNLKKLSESDRKQLTELKEKSIENMAENEIMKNKIENLCNEKAFLLQDLILYKSQISESDVIINQMESKLAMMAKEKEEREGKEDKLRTLEEEFGKRIKVLEEEREKERERTRKEMKMLEEQLVVKLGTIRELSQTIEELENRVNYLMKKNESLQNEARDGIKEENELNKLKELTYQQERTIRDLKKNLEEENRNKKVENQKTELLASIANFLQGNSQHSQQIHFMQNLANNLTEVITDRELALENQKNINKELIKRINELEEKNRK